MQKYFTNQNDLQEMLYLSEFEKRKPRYLAMRFNVPRFTIRQQLKKHGLKIRVGNRNNKDILIDECKNMIQKERIKHTQHIDESGEKINPGKDYKSYLRDGH